MAPFWIESYRNNHFSDNKLEDKFSLGIIFTSSMRNYTGVSAITATE